MEIQHRFRYRYHRRKKGWRVAASAVELTDGWLEYNTYTNYPGRTKQWQKQMLDPARGWTTIFPPNKPVTQGRIGRSGLAR